MCGKFIDINIKLINAIKKYPTLYKNNATVEERKVNWQNLAAEVGLPAQFIMTRWHFLRESYQKLLYASNFDDFKYKSQMEFMRPYMRASCNSTKLQTHSVSLQLLDAEMEEQHIFKPEFVITESDINENSRQSAENETELGFMELDMVSNKLEDVKFKQMQESSSRTSVELLREDTEEEENELQIDMQSSTTIEQNELTHSDETEEKQDMKNFSLKKELPENKPDITALNANSNHADSTVQANLQQKQQNQAIKRHSQAEPYHESNAKQSKLTESTIRNETPVERCEDVIFVELVAAMLKTMPPERKRAVKKEIMNILL